MLWVALFGRDAICAVDENSGAVRQTVALRDLLGRSILGVRRLLLDARRNCIYCALSLANEVAVLRLGDDAPQVSSIPVGAYPTGLCLLEPRVLVCCSESDSLWAIDANFAQALSCVSLPGYPVGPTPCTSGREALVCAMHGNTLWRVGNDLGICNERSLPRSAACACDTKDGRFVAALLPSEREETLFGGALVHMAWDATGVFGLSRTGDMPGSIARHPSVNLVAVTEMQRNQVLLWQMDAANPIAVDVGALPDDLAWSKDGKRLYVSCTLDQSIFVLDAHGTVLERWEMPGEPRGLAL